MKRSSSVISLICKKIDRDVVPSGRFRALQFSTFMIMIDYNTAAFAPLIAVARITGNNNLIKFE